MSAKQKKQRVLQQKGTNTSLVPTETCNSCSPLYVEETLSNKNEITDNNRYSCSDNNTINKNINKNKANSN